jgi:hypothetical protein
MKKYLIIISFLFISGICSAQLKWEVVGKMPYPVSGGQVVYDIAGASDKIYIFGGYSDSLQSAVDWIQEYDILNGVWNIVGRMLQPRDQFVADIWKNNIFYCGGTISSSTDNNSIEGWDFKIVSNLASTYDRNVNFARQFSTGQIVGDNLYLIGGDPSNAGETVPYISAYNLNTKQVGFTFNYQSPNPPRQRMTFIVGDNIYIFGGVTNGVMKAIQKFNISGQKLIDLPEQLIEARAAGSAIYNPLSKRGFIIGGYNETQSAMNTVEQVVIQSDGSLKITPTAPLVYARTGMMAVAYKNGFLIVFGGRTDRGHLGKVVPYVERLVDATTSVDENKLPEDFSLNQNYPNPFNPSTTISYQLQSGSFVSLKIYDALGREVAVLVKEFQNSGTHTVQLNAEKYNLTAGIYFYRLTAGNYSSTKKMLLLK